MFGDIPYPIIIAAFGFIQAIAITIIAGLFNRESKKRKKENEAIERQRKEENAKLDSRAKIRAQEITLAMQLMSANTSLAVATGLALKEERVNGQMDIALAEAGKAQADYFKFINSLASEQMAAD